MDSCCPFLSFGFVVDTAHTQVVVDIVADRVGEVAVPASVHAGTALRQLRRHNHRHVDCSSESINDPEAIGACT